MLYLRYFDEMSVTKIDLKKYCGVLSSRLYVHGMQLTIDMMFDQQKTYINDKKHASIQKDFLLLLTKYQSLKIFTVISIITV